MGRIIVIEDNPVFRDHVCGMLEKAGYKTRTAYDCAGARRLLAELDDGDIIVSDLRLPDGECTEVLERMREAGIRNPFVIMTDYAQVASAVSSMRLGAEDYIPKTLLQEKLLPRIRELVRKSERRHTMPILERRSAAFRTAYLTGSPDGHRCADTWRERHGQGTHCRKDTCTEYPAERAVCRDRLRYADTGAGGIRAVRIRERRVYGSHNRKERLHGGG